MHFLLIRVSSTVFSCQVWSSSVLLRRLEVAPAACLEVPGGQGQPRAPERWPATSGRPESGSRRRRRRRRRGRRGQRRREEGGGQRVSGWPGFGCLRLSIVQWRTLVSVRNAYVFLAPFLGPRIRIFRCCNILALRSQVEMPQRKI